MTGLSRFLGPPPDPDQRARNGLARMIAGKEVEVASHEVYAWAELQKLMIDLRAQGRARTTALRIEFSFYEDGLVAAAGDPVKQELLIRHLQDLDSACRADITRVLG